MDAQVLTSAEERLISVRSSFAPPTERTVSEFADQEIVLTSGPMSGTRWQTDFAPYQRGIMDATHELGVEFIVVMGSSQWGKTAILVNACCYFIAHDPCSILIVEPTVKPMAEDFGKNRLDPTIRASPALAALVDKKRAKDASNTVLQKTYRGGFLALAGANSAASLAARPVRVLMLDEIDRYPAELPGEGSTLSIAIKRTTTYRSRRRVYMFSSPTIEGAPIHSWYLRGDQRKYFVPCPSCGELHTFEWKNIKWIDRDPATARLHCPACDYAIDNGEREAILQHGEWRSTVERPADPRVVSFHLWEAYSPLSSLREIVANFLSAREKQKAGDKAEMHTWQNTTLGEPREPDKGDGAESHTLIARREPYAAEVPNGACLLTMGVDTQDNWLEALVFAWGPGEECWIVDRHRFDGNTDQPEPWQQLDRLLEREYQHESGQRLGIAGTCIDSGGHRTTMVYDYAKRQAARRVFAIIGRDGNRPIVSSPSPRKYGREQRPVPLYTIGVDSAKAIWLSRLKLSEAGPGFVHLPVTDWCDEELAQQLTSEALVTKWTAGVPRQVWKKLRPRNEALDIAVYGLGALRLLHPNLDQLHRQLLQQPEGKTPKPAAPTTDSKWISRRTDWLKGRR